MSVEYWFLILLAAVLLMAELVRMTRSGNLPGATPVKRRRPEGAAVAGEHNRPRAQANYALAPRKPDVMAGTLFDLLAGILNYDQMVAFADIVISGETTSRYIERLARGEATAATAEKLAFYNTAMDVNGYGGAQRARVAEVISRRADKQSKLLEIHRNMDRIF